MSACVVLCGFVLRGRSVLPMMHRNEHACTVQRAWSSCVPSGAVVRQGRLFLSDRTMFVAMYIVKIKKSQRVSLNTCATRLERQWATSCARRYRLDDDLG